MATFTHDATGTPESAWLASRLAVIRPLAVPSGTKLVVLAAHPDDESLGAGGLISIAAAAGAPIEVLIASDGEASHPASPTHSPARLARLRRAEAVAAMQALAPAARVTFLGLPDGSLAEHVGRVAEELRARCAGPVCMVAPWFGDRHPDHAACAAAAALVAGEAADRVLWQYPIWAWHWADPDGADLPWDRLARLDLPPRAMAAKQQAIAAHRSQHQPLSPAPGDQPILTAETLLHFRRDFETFVLAAPTSADQPGYFDALYRADADPWRLGTRFYEARKRDLIVAALPRPRFRRAFEPGCATGLLTAALAERCAEIVCYDVADDAIRQTRRRLGGQARVERGRIPDDWPAGSFDLIALSEVGYYCRDLDALTERVHATLADDGVLVACHWRHAAPDHPQTSDAVHAALGRGLHRIVQHMECDFRLDVWTRTGRSVAEETGIVA